MQPHPVIDGNSITSRISSFNVSNGDHDHVISTDNTRYVASFYRTTVFFNKTVPFIFRSRFVFDICILCIIMLSACCNLDLVYSAYVSWSYFFECFCHDK